MLPPLCQSSIGVLGEEWSGFAPRSLEAPTLLDYELMGSLDENSAQSLDQLWDLTKDFSAGIWWTLIFGTGTLLLHDEFLVRLNPATLPTPNEGSLGDCTVYIPVSRNSSNISWNASNAFEISS
ncbi:hypothetical protein WN944_007323 [Citrus x changshan-huyou]|uniref:Uncharacterized protein n=1 Tax=Citrus x changshan-huyou TaxID=2935761 RepID=A0AAP0MNB0_9ROSI